MSRGTGLGNKPNPHKHIYNSKIWKQLRLHILSSEPLCRLCPKPTPAHHVDHITPLSKGGEPYEYENLQPLCAECHSRKTREDEGATVKWGCDEHGNPIDPKSHWNK
jgi:5-methylcytosine-specific restriction protein A